MIRINLAPPPTRRRGGSGLRLTVPAFNIGLLFLVVYVAAVAGIGSYWWKLTHEETRLAADVDAANAELARLKPVTAQADKVKADLTDLRKRVKTIEDITKNQSRPIRMLDAFANVVPHDLWITRMEERGNVLKVTGSAFTAAAVSDLMSNLRQSGRFKDVDITLSKQDLAKAPRLVTFEVICRFDI